MSFHSSNWAISVASCYSCIVLLCHTSSFSSVDAFAGLSQQPQQFATASTATPPNHQRHASPINKFAFLQCRRPQSNYPRNDVCIFATDGSEDGLEEFEVVDEDDEDSEEGAVAEETDSVEEEDEGHYDEEEEEEEEEPEEVLPLEDDPSDPNYTAQKAAVEQSLLNRQSLEAVKDLTFGPGSAQRLRTNIEEFLDEQLAEAGVSTSAVDETFRTMEVTEEEAGEAMEAENRRMREEGRGPGVPYDRRAKFLTELGTAAEAFPDDDDPIMADATDPEESVLADDLLKLQAALGDLVDTTKGYATGESISNKQALIDVDYELELLDEDTLDEIDLCLNASATDANGLDYKESIRNEDPVRWILYDMDFNVTELMLASCKHNPDAPLLLNHWMPQLCALSKYADARRRDFAFTWEDADAVDTSELLRYYRGLGYDEIPTFSPKDTNIVEIETAYDDEDISMAAFEDWMDRVYDDEEEDLYFDSDEFQPENNVYDFDYGTVDSPEFKQFEVELEEFRAEHGDETQEWQDNFAKEVNYTVVVDQEAKDEFRGYLVVACCGSDEDVEIAETITRRMGEAHGKQVHVETRVYSHARQSDNVYEIWLESYDITLLHSKRGASYNAKQWAGPAEVDEEQMDYLVDRVGYLISDDSRYSYHLHEFVTEV